MGKKKRNHGAPTAAELIVLRVQAEQEWSYLRRMERLSYRAIAALAARPTSEGGLDHAMSPQAVSSLVQGYYTRMSDVQQETLEQHRDRELEELDATTRAIGIQLAEDRANGIRLDPALVRELRMTGERRAKVLGLDAVAGLEVQVAEGNLDQLNAALIELGREPIYPDRERAADRELNRMLAEAGIEIEP